jgi:hypothetical protein
VTAVPEPERRPLTVYDQQLPRIFAAAEARAAAVRAAGLRRRCVVCGRAMLVQPADWDRHKTCRTPQQQGPA